jgi:sugar lactone lactonase YvrE
MGAITELTLRPQELHRVGHDLARPENVLAFRDGTVFASSNRGHITRIAPDGRQWRIGRVAHDAPTTMALADDDSLIVNNTGDGNLYRLHLDGRSELLLDTIEGRPIGSANYVFLDSRGRLWIAVATRNQPPHGPADPTQALGYIAVVEDGEARIVADGLAWPNEVRLDATESYAYVPETMAQRVVRFRVTDAGELTGKEVVGPERLDPGILPDGIALDVEGNVWVALLSGNGVLVITPDGDTHTLFADRNEEALANLAAEYDARAIQFPSILACRGPHVQTLTSIGFAGPELKTVVMGSLLMPHLLSFASPVAGLPLRHQHRAAAPPQPVSELAPMDPA